MAKQTGIIALRGKIKGQSYYGSKVGGDLVRTINEGMSARVKTGKEYANTRKNNSEFGMCGDFAGAIIKPITLRWRFILDSIATGKMVKKMKELTIFDSTHPWGQRTIDSSLNSLLREAFNSFSKNEMIDEIAATLAAGVSYDESETQITLANAAVLSTSRQQELIEMGINHIDVKVFALHCAAPSFNSATQQYVKANATFVEIPDLGSSQDITGAAQVSLFGQENAVFDVSSVAVDNEFGGFMVVYLPGRKIGSVVSTLQEHCAAELVGYTPA